MFRFFPVLGLAAVVISASAAMAQGCDPLDKLVTATPAPPHDLESWRTFARQADAVSGTKFKTQSIDLVLIGDSLAQAWDDKSWLPARVLNLGVGGDQTQHVLWRLSNADWSRLNTRRVLIILGTNNLSAGDEPCAILFGIQKVIDKSRRLWPTARIGVMAIPPRGPDFQEDARDRIEVNQALKLIPGVTAINVDDAITCNWKTPCENFRSDNTHFTDAGYHVLLGKVRGALF